ncbi:hypothetical protein MMC17_001925 [Xylographa soralifera]|nr:hypothetical protein [Xylographa soralifera]
MTLPKIYEMQSEHGTIAVPSVGFGTFAAGDTSWCYSATLTALKAGYRHLDCAWNYGVDEAVGAAIRDSQIPRSEIFITSKFWPQFGAPENVEKCLNLCLANMGLDYLDLFLAHWPVTFRAGEKITTAKASEHATTVDRGEASDGNGRIIIDWAHCCESISAAHGEIGSYKSTWRELQRLVGTGKVRAVGVSNFNIEQLQEILTVGGNVPVSCNQIEAHPWFPNTELITFMKANGILPTVYCPFARPMASEAIGGLPVLLNDPDVKRLAEENTMGVGQLLQSWAVQRGTVPLGKSRTPGSSHGVLCRSQS